MNNDIVLLGHGSGGKLSHQLLDDLIIPNLSNVATEDQDDAAVLPITGSRLAFTTDSYVVDPIFFPGGDIGDLAVNGTVNDLAMSGARPYAISVGLILEEGLLLSDLQKILQSMKAAADKAGVKIVTGDTKVVPRGKGDKIFINTSGVGLFEHDIKVGGSLAKPGDKVIINGTIGDHGMAILSSREGLEFEAPIETDSMSVNAMVADLLETFGTSVHVLRDPTRGGVATTLKEISVQSGVSITLQENGLPVTPAVQAACDILGLDPLFVANEGKLLTIVSADVADAVVARMQTHPEGEKACIIGEVSDAPAGKVYIQTAIGGRRSVEMLSGEQLPRIC